MGRCDTFLALLTVDFLYYGLFFMPIRALVVINKDGNTLGPSETFLQAHIEGLPCEVIALIGSPGYRRLNTTGRYILSRALVPLSFRWLFRHLGFSTVANQDAKAVSRLIHKKN